MRKIIGIGETLLDIIFKNDEPTMAVPGGSTFNALVSLGRAGVRTCLISETGDDRVGRRICSFAQENGIDTSSVHIHRDAKSPLSLAFLNEENDAEYLFYKDKVSNQPEFLYPDVKADDIVLFGSYYALNPGIRQEMKDFLEYAHRRGAILYYDVNFRSSHSNEAVKLTPALFENFELADVVRGSTEDFDNLFHLNEADNIYKEKVKFYCSQFLCTRGGEGVSLRTKEVDKDYPVNKVEAVSTIGAGDNFNAGILYGLMKHNITREEFYSLREDDWSKLIGYAMEFSTNVCQSLNNYVDREFGERMKSDF